MRLRRARPHDAESVAAINNRCWKTAYRGVLPDDGLDAIELDDRVDTWRQIAEERPDWFLVAVDAHDAVVGYVVVDPDPAGEPGHVGEVDAIYVDPDRWRTGAGRLLLAAAYRLLVDAGCTEAMLATLAGVDATQAFYRAEGWAADGTSFTYEFTDRPLGTQEHIRMRRPIGRADEVLANRARWEGEAAWYAEVAARNWDATELTWGTFGVADADLGGAMPDVAGKDVLEIGCGTGYVSNTCLQAGARWAAGLDNSPDQLATASRMAAERDVSLPLIHGDGNRLPIRDASFDVAINEYGAAIWCDPYRWIPEAARVLRDGGLLWFMGNSVLQMLTQPDYEAEPIGARLVRPQRGMHRFTWPDDDGVEYHLSHGDLIRLLRDSGFEVLDLIEVYTDPDADSRYSWADPEWSSQWPIEEIWIARRRPRARVAVAR